MKSRSAAVLGLPFTANPMFRSSISRIATLAALAALFPGFLSAEILDTLSFGNSTSESQHTFSVNLSDIAPGGPGKSARRLPPGDCRPEMSITRNAGP